VTGAANKWAIRVYTKVGFREVGRRRGAGLTMGRRHDGVFMDLLASEFLQAGGSMLPAVRHTGSAQRPARRASGVTSPDRQRALRLSLPCWSGSLRRLAGQLQTASRS
jgi:hypothetical protein